MGSVAYHRPEPALVRLRKMDGAACKSRVVSSGKQTGKWQIWSDSGVLLVFESEMKVDFEHLDTRPIVSLPNSPSLHTHACRKIVWDTH